MAERLNGELILALGSNLGNRKENLTKSIELINEHIGEVTMISQYFENEPVDFDSKNQFINMCVKVVSEKNPAEILKEIKSIEKSMGRTKTSKRYEDRPIDIDIILYNELVLKSNQLIIPHPSYSKRPFVLAPMCEIGDYLDPNIFLTCKQLLE